MGGLQIREQWTGFRVRLGRPERPVGWLWSAAWGVDGEDAVYMAVWKRVDSIRCFGQSLRGTPEAISARWTAEVEQHVEEGYNPLGRRLRRGLPAWKDGSAIALALAEAAGGSNPMVQAGVLRDQLKRANGRAGVESLWGEFQTLRARLEAKAEYGDELSRRTAAEALEALVGGMREALA